MRFFFAALLFVFAVGIFTFVAKVVYLGTVETELQEMSLAALRNAELRDVHVEFDHHDATISGTVDSEEEKSEVLNLLKETVPFAHLPKLEELKVSIRPTIPPELAISKEAGSGLVTIVGVLGEMGESSRSLLGTRIHAIEAIKEVKNEVVIDPRRLPLVHAAELASLTVSLLEHSDEARVRLADGVLEISGQVPNDGLKAGILELASLVEATTTQEEIKVVPPVNFLEPSRLTMTRNRFGVTLTGILPSEEVRASLAQSISAAQSGVVNTDRLEVGQNVAPAAWQEKPAEIFPILLERFSGEMTAEFAENRIRLNGLVPGEDDREALIAALSPLRNTNPDLEILSNIQLNESTGEEGPAARLFATYENGLLTLTGNLPDASFVPSLEEAFKKSFPDVLIKNEIEQTPSSPAAGWTENLEGFFEEIPGRIETAVISFADNTLNLEGKTLELADRQVIQNVAINTVPPNFTINNQLMHKDQPFPEPELLPEARARIAESLKQFPIYFDSNSEIVTEKERAKVDGIYEVLEGAGKNLDLLVTGFADNVGNAEYNRQLSLRRASSVLKILVSLGIAEENISTDSKGEDVSNVARSERWRARRVEVSLAPDEETESPSEESSN